jgi:hypothetical protein
MALIQTVEPEQAVCQAKEIYDTAISLMRWHTERIWWDPAS